MTMCSSLCVLRLVSLEGARPLGVRALGVQAAKNIGTPSKNKKNPPGRPSRGTSYAQIKKLADSKASRGMIREIVIRPGLKVYQGKLLFFINIIRRRPSLEPVMVRSG